MRDGRNEGKEGKRKGNRQEDEVTALDKGGREVVHEEEGKRKEKEGS